MIDHKEVRQLALELGADLCGIAPVSRFDKAPQGFHPRDVYPDAHSVVAYECWDEDRREGRALLSLRHAGWLAGLGVLGKNTLLTNGQYGNRLSLGALLLNIELEGDPMVAPSFCLPTCRLCIDACPVGALNGETVNQRLCRGQCEGRTKKNEPIYTCNVCRRVCPRGRQNPGEVYP